MHKKIMYLLLITLTSYAMKQQKFIKKVIDHPEGIYLINRALEETKKITKFYRSYVVSKNDLSFFIKKNRRIVFNHLTFLSTVDTSALRECDGTTLANLIFPCPDTFVKTVNPLLKKRNNDLVVDDAAVAESGKYYNNKSEQTIQKINDPLYGWQKQCVIFQKMNNDPRRSITFYKTAAQLKPSLWEEQNRCDQIVIQEWGGTDIMSIIEPNEPYDLMVKMDHYLFNIPVREDNKALMEVALVFPTHGGFCHNPQRDVLIAEQNGKDYKDYAIVYEKAPWLFESQSHENIMRLEDATLLEDCGFYGMSGLRLRNSRAYNDCLRSMYNRAPKEDKASHEKNSFVQGPTFWKREFKEDSKK